MKIAVIGNGGVGKALIKLLRDKEKELAAEGLHPKICCHLDSGGGIYDPSGIDLDELIWYNEGRLKLSDYPEGGIAGLSLAVVMAQQDIQTVIELTPTNRYTGEPGMTHIQQALENGANVITANKGPVMLAYARLKKLAEAKGVQLWIGCTTGGALPSINGGIMDLAGARICSIEGILNGTTNFILDEMKARNTSYELALQKARELGIAETDPTLDVEGWDTAAKLLILTNVLMKKNISLKEVDVTGITRITPGEIKDAGDYGGKMKLVGRALRENQQLSLKVAPEVLTPDHPLYGVDGKNKAVRYTTDTLGDLTMTGGASGTLPAAASVLRDLVNLHRGYQY